MQQSAADFAYVYINTVACDGLHFGEPSLFLAPCMRLLEDPTTFLRDRYVGSGKRTSSQTWRNAAYALASWFDFLLAIELSDWRHAARDHLLAYRNTFSCANSPFTGRKYAIGTLVVRMSVIYEFYAYARNRRWYCGDIAQTDSGFQHQDCIPKYRRSRTSIHPLSRSELVSLLNALGPRASEHASGHGSCRDRLIGDLGWAVGLRLSEINQLSIHQFNHLNPVTSSPATEHPLIVRGKGGFDRTVAIPSWLVADAKSYIAGERTKALAAAGDALTNKSTLLVSNAASTKPGSPLTKRRMQQIIEHACISANLVVSFDHQVPGSPVSTRRQRASHCLHDLRHTYAVMTYWAERHYGNSEPWKMIQAQLGHAKLQTTVDTYLRFVEIFAKDAGIPDIRAMLEI